MKKKYILILIAIFAIFSISTVSAGLFDGLVGGNVNFLDLTMTVDGAEFEDGSSRATSDSYTVDLYNITDDDEGRITYLAKSLKKGDSAKIDEDSISNAFKEADGSIANTVSYLYDENDVQTCAKSIVSFNELKSYKEITVDDKKGADFIVSDSVIYDDSGSSSMLPNYITDPDSGKTSNDLARWVLIYDDSTSTLYGIEIHSTKTNVVTDQSVLENSEVQSMIDSITFK